MELNRFYDRAAECERRAALRQNILQYGRLLRWPTRTSIAFVERATRRPWKRCTSDQLVDLAGELSTIHQLRQQASLDVVESSAPERLPGGSHVRRA
jgi:hypothetical protein